MRRRRKWWYDGWRVEKNQKELYTFYASGIYMKIHYIGQSGIIIEYKDLVIGIDLWLDNPLNPIKIKDIPQCHYLFWTHDHFDHGKDDMIKLAKRDNSTMVTTYKKAEYCKAEWVKNIWANIGSMFSIGDNIQVALIRADHSCDIDIPVWFCIQIYDKIIYHMGDTWFMSEFATLKEFYDIETVFIPIWGRFTMWPHQWAKAASLLQAKNVIPIHYNTFEPLTQDPNVFIDQCQWYGYQWNIHIVKPGETIKI